MSITINGQTNTLSGLSVGGLPDGCIAPTDLSTGGPTWDAGGNLLVSGIATVSSLNNGPISGARNRIINGDMRLDQRNSGVSTTVGSSAYTLDRWMANEATDGVATIIRSATAPVGFTSSLLWTTTTADTSLAASQTAYVQQLIEGYNISDLAWGTSSAKSITVSFWVRSSLTGTFSGGIQNNGPTYRSYPFTYTISSANTFEYKTITIPGDTTGTWATDNTLGMYLVFSLGTGSTYQGTANTWQTGNVWAVAGETPVIGTLNATWYVTGVQLEVGTVATPFERRSYGQELALAQRYYVKVLGVCMAGNTSAWLSFVAWPVQMRAVPTVTSASGGSYSGQSTQTPNVFGWYGVYLQGGTASGTVDSQVIASAEL